MKPSSKSTTLSNSNSSKQKKTSKDRSRKKSQTQNETVSQNNSENDFISQTSGNCKLAGFSVESLNIYHEQSFNMQLSEKAFSGFLGDLNYKIRQIIYEAQIKSVLSRRNYINSEDFDYVLENLNIEQVYGAPLTPEWLKLSECNIMYLNDTSINLIDISESEFCEVQPGDVYSTNRWITDPPGATEAQKNYFVTICNSVIDLQKDVREYALKDLKTNSKIGPFCEWFYHFGYLLLSKDITYKSLTVYALDLIEALEINPVAPLSVSEDRLELLVHLILQRLFQPTSIEILTPMSKILVLLCRRAILFDYVQSKIKKYKSTMKLSAQVVHLANSFGIETIREIVLADHSLFLKAEDLIEQELVNELLNSYNILCCEKENTYDDYNLYYHYFGESTLIYNRFVTNNAKEQNRLDDSQVQNIQLRLLKTRRNVKINDHYGKKRYNLGEVFSLHEDEDISKIKFKFKNFVPEKGPQRFLKAAPTNCPEKSRNDFVMIGRVHLLAQSLRINFNNNLVSNNYNFRSYII